jgi:hypothetical protein
MTADELKEQIAQAFAEAKPGEIGVRTASAIDSRYDEDQPDKLAAARRADARERHWSQIPHEVLAADPAVFSYFDERGFLFVLPAVMSWRLAPDYDDRWRRENRGGEE